MVVMLAACSNKTNTARSRFWQAFTTKYNVYFHGKENYDEQLKAMLDNYEDDYSQHLYMHPAEARSNPKAPQPGGSFDLSRRSPNARAARGATPSTRNGSHATSTTPTCTMHGTC